MVQYTLKESPEVILTVEGKIQLKPVTRRWINSSTSWTQELDIELSEGFGPQFIEVKEPVAVADSDEDAIVQAVGSQQLSHLKLKVQELRAEALKVRAQVDILFTDEPISEDEIASIKEGFKVLKTFAQANLRYQEACPKQSRLVLCSTRLLNLLNVNACPDCQHFSGCMSHQPTMQNHHQGRQRHHQAGMLPSLHERRSSTNQRDSGAPN